MPSFATTGETGPAWIREEVLRLERAWPFWLLAGGAGAVILVELILGVILWQAEPVSYYAHP